MSLSWLGKMKLNVSPYLVASVLLLCAWNDAFAQSSHRDLSRELLKDLQRAVSDSLSIDRENLKLNISGNSSAAAYLSAIEKTLRHEGYDNEKADLKQVSIKLLEYSMEINQNSLDSLRNTPYIRKLAINVTFGINGDEFKWQSSIYDDLSKHALKTLLDEHFPENIRGDYLNRTPATVIILLTTLGVFTSLAALYFIRT